MLLFSLLHKNYVAFYLKGLIFNAACNYNSSAFMLPCDNRYSSWTYPTRLHTRLP